jgi:uncharacterized membrane protein YdjX (TVP38/TMEM64 family)
MQDAGAPPPATGGTKPGAGLRRVAPFLLFAACAIGIAVTVGRNATPALVLAHYDLLRDAVATRPVWTVLAYILIYALAVALSIPGSLILTVVGGLLFGWLAGGLAAIVAATAGGVVLFLIARTTIGRYLAERGGARLAALLQGLRDDAVNYLLFLRLTPVFPFWLVNIAAGIVGMRVPQFVGATLVGMVPATFAFSSAGAALDDVFAVQSKAFAACRAAGGHDCRFDLSLSSVLTPGVLAALVALGLLALLPVALRRWRPAAAKTVIPPENCP